MEWLISTVLLITVFLWATNLVSVLVTTIFFFLSMWLTFAAPISVIFSGFTSSAFWLVFAGAVIGYSLKNSGLNQRISYIMAICCRESYNMALFNFALISTIFSFFMPSTFARIAILIPVITSFCDRIGLSTQSLGRTGLILIVTVGSFEISSSILTANLPNLILLGVSQKNFNINLSYGEYLFYLFLTAGVLKGVVLVIVAKIMFPEKFSYTKNIKVENPLSKHEKYLLVLLTMTILAWVTDFIHHISPALIGLIFSFVYLLSIKRAHIKDFVSSLKLDFFLFIASVISFSSIVQYRGISQLIIQSMHLHSIFNGSVLYLYLFLVSGSIILSLLVTSNISPVLFSTVFGSLSNKWLTTKAILLSQVVGYSTVFFPYQAPPILFGANLGGISSRLVTRYCIFSGFISLFTITLINYFWWKLIKLIG